MTFLFIPQLQQYLRDGLNDFNISTIRKAYDQIIDVEPRLVQVLGEENPDIIIMSDGNSTPETAPKLIEAGVSILVSGSCIIKSQNFEKAINDLKSAVAQ